MNKFCVFTLLFVTFLLTGCITDVAKLQLGGVKSVELQTVSFTSSELLASVDLLNKMKKEVIIYEASITSKDIEPLNIQLNDELHLQPGNNSLKVPLRINYSVATALILAGGVIKGNNDCYIFDISLKFKKGEKGAINKINFRKKFSKQEIRNLISRIKK